jgi:hypothetical protein
MLRILLASALGALFLSFTPLSAQTTPDTIGGTMRGTWDLPFKDQPGRARGVMFYLGDVVVGLDARLTRFPDPGDARGGRIDGVLRRRTDTGFSPDPIAEVHGTFMIGLDGRGRFEAMIVPLAVAGIRAEPIGKIGGVFYDPMTGDRNTVGRFMGRWAMWL